MYYKFIDRDTTHVKDGALVVATIKRNPTIGFTIRFAEDNSQGQGPTHQSVPELAEGFFDLPIVPYCMRNYPTPQVPINIVVDDRVELVWLPEYKLPRLRRVRVRVDDRWVVAHKWVEEVTAV